LDIKKSLQKGEVPKRGGPNDKKVEPKTQVDEIDSEINNELNSLDKEVAYEKKVLEMNQKYQGNIELCIYKLFIIRFKESRRIKKSKQ